MADGILRNMFERNAPSRQAAIDIFAGQWWTAMPDGSGLQAGPHSGFSDSRPAWVNSKISLDGATVAELGPFEAYGTWQLERHGAHVTAVESNTFNYLKCLIVKENIGLKAGILCGDATKFLMQSDARYDFVWASGILYHQVDPAGFLDTVSRRTDRVFVWTHYWDDVAAAQPRFDGEFVPGRDSVRHLNGTELRYRYRRYSLGEATPPNNWSGGTEPHTNWLTRDDLLAALKAVGFDRIEIQVDGVRLDILPVISLLAYRS